MITQSEKDLLYFETRAVAFDMAAREYTRSTHVNSVAARACREGSESWAAIAGEIRRAIEEKR
jgi:hypothetical protein